MGKNKRKERLMYDIAGQFKTKEAAKVFLQTLIDKILNNSFFEIGPETVIKNFIISVDVAMEKGIESEIDLFVVGKLKEILQIIKEFHKNLESFLPNKGDE